MKTRVGIIRCEAQSQNCAGFNCFPAMRNRMGRFESYEEVELVGFDTCGGCERDRTDRIVSRAQRLKDKGAEAIHLASCVIGACPFEEAFSQAIQQKTGVPVVRGTHPIIG